MTPDKRVEEIVGEINLNIRKNCNALICSACGGGGYNYDKEQECVECLASGITNWDFDFLNKQLTQIITQYHQDLMSEVVEKIANFDHNNRHLCRFNDAPQKCECYYGGIETAQTIIKSLSK